MSLFAKHSQGGGIEMQNQSKVVIARCFVFLLALSVVIGSSCTLKQQQQHTTLRIWQTAVDPKAVAVLKDIGAEFERTHPGVRVEIESVAWGRCLHNSLPQSGRVTHPT